METQACCATPPLDAAGRWDIHTGNQDGQFTQQCLAMVLGVPQHAIEVRMERTGGAFGGKLTRQMLPVAAVSVAAAKLRRPIRCVVQHINSGHQLLLPLA